MEKGGKNGTEANSKTLILELEKLPLVGLFLRPFNRKSA